MSAGELSVQNEVINTNIVSSRHRGIGHYLLIWKAIALSAIELHCEALAIAVT